MNREVLQSSFATDGPPAPSPDDCEALPYQRGGVDYARKALSRHGSALIADEMGLGKTVQAICVANACAADKVLVVCPASVRINWGREARKWGLSSRFDVKSYEEVVRRGTSERYDLAIFDESQYLKNPEAKRTQACLAVQAPRLFLSGTPLVNRPIELWPILNSVDPQAWGTRHEFGSLYCGARLENTRTKRGWVTEWTYRGATNLKELQGLLRSTIMVRRLKKHVLKDLPPKTRQIIELPALSSGTDAALLDAVRKMWKNRTMAHDAVSVAGLRDGGEVLVKSKISKARHDQALAKLPAALAHIRDVLEGGTQKVIVFAHHRDVIEGLMKGLEPYGAGIVYGGMDDRVKQKTVDGFQDGPLRVFIGQMEAAGKGLTLTASSTVIFVELDWVPGVMSQCEDRAHRIGQKDNVLVQHIVLDGSIDARISKALMRKQRVLDQTLDGDADTLAPLDWVAALASEEAA